MSEAAVVAWLAAHPFWHAELILILGAVQGLAVADWERFKQFKADDPLTTFKWRVALWQYSKAILVAGVPPIFAGVWRILGAAPPVVALIWHWFF